LTEASESICSDEEDAQEKIKAAMNIRELAIELDKIEN